MPLIAHLAQQLANGMCPSSTCVPTAVSSYRGETLKLQGSRSEMGSYLCISSNGVPPSISKRISLTVQCE